MGVPVSVSVSIGAKCPFIVFESADIDSAVDGVIEAAFRKKREVIYRKKSIPCQTMCLMPSKSDPPLFLSILSPLRSTGCCVCRRACRIVWWPVSDSVWQG